MAASPHYVFHDLKPPADRFLEDVIAGLSARPKALAPKYFYDERGSVLFEAICELPEYYPTRTELAMLHADASDIAARLGRGADRHDPSDAARAGRAHRRPGAPGAPGIGRRWRTPNGDRSLGRKQLWH